MDIYGFKAIVKKDGKWFTGEISELHVQDQAITLRELENELKDAVETAVKFFSEQKNSKSRIKSTNLRSLFVRA